MGINIPVPLIGQKITANTVKGYVTALAVPAVYEGLDKLWSSFTQWSYFTG
jgi:hypothetical protein